MWFQLRSPELAEDFERLMTEDRDIVRGSLDTVSDWRLTRPADVPGQSIGQADYVLIAEIVQVERWEQQASEHVQRLADDLAHLVSSRGMLVVRPSFEIRGRWRAIRPMLQTSLRGAVAGAVATVVMTLEQPLDQLPLRLQVRRRRDPGQARDAR